MWTVDGNLQESESDVDSGWKYVGIIFSNKFATSDFETSHFVTGVGIFFFK